MISIQNGGNRFVNDTHLIIVNASISDSGHYMCYAASQFGSNNRTAWISVLPEEVAGRTRIDVKIRVIFY